MKKNKEIERRWLLRRPPLIGAEIPRINIAQYYVIEDDENIRYRMSINWDDSKPNKKYYKTIKHKTDTEGEWDEYEEEISEKDFNKAIKMNPKSPKVLKTRYLIKDGDLTWELDEFINMNITILEVELSDIDEDIKIPDSLEKYIITEITGNDEFQNYNLAW